MDRTRTSMLRHDLWLTVVVAGVLLAGCARFSTAGQAAQTSDPSAIETARAWCLSSGTSDPPSQVLDAGQRWLGTTARSADTAESDAQWDSACRLAFDLWGLSEDQWTWCLQPSVSSLSIRPAIAMLGLGRQEAAGRDPFAEQPGDDPAEFTQACRFASTYWKDGSPGTMPSDEDLAAFLAVNDADQQWCDAHPAALDDAAAQLDLPETAPGSLAARLSQARACRFAAIVGTAPSPAPTSAPTQAPAQIRYQALVVNHTSETLSLVDVGAGEDYGLPVRGCSALRINGVDRPLPWSLGYQLGDGPVVPIVARDSADDDAELGYEIIANPDGSVDVNAVLPVGPAVLVENCG